MGSSAVADVHDAPNNRAVQPSPALAPTSRVPNDAMLAFFLSQLSVRAMAVRPSLASDDWRTALLSELESKLDGFAARFPTTASSGNHAAWNEAYRLERVLALIEPKDNLLSELQRQIADAAEEGLASSARLTASLAAALPIAFDTSKTPPEMRERGETVLRALLLQTLEELHWAYQRKFYARPIQKSATYRIVSMGTAALFVFLLPYLFLYSSIILGRDPHLEKWSGLPLYTALTAGLFGAFFSRVIYLQQNWNNLTLGAIMDAKEFTSILLRGCVGMTGAVVVYFFLQSGAMNGALFPKFGEISFEQKLIPSRPDDGTRATSARPSGSATVSASNRSTADGEAAATRPSPEPAALPFSLFYPNAALALLVVWCFIAGFSERLVPSILQSTESTIGKSGAPK